MLEGIRDLYAYSAWANARILDTAEQLTPEQFTTSGDGFDSVRDTLVHTASAAMAVAGTVARHAHRPSCGTRQTLPTSQHFGPAGKRLRRRHRSTSPSLREPDLARVVSYVNFQGERWAYPLWQQLLHQVNHATQHRSEAALLLTRLGYSPGWLDLLVYVDEQGDESVSR